MGKLTNLPTYFLFNWTEKFYLAFNLLENFFFMLLTILNLLKIFSKNEQVKSLGDLFSGFTCLSPLPKV